MAQQPVFLVDTSVFVAHLRQTKAPTILEIARERYGTPVTFIAATALHEDLPLLTLNIDHFRRVDGLNLLAVPER